MMLNPLPYPLALLQTAALAMAVNRPAMHASARASYPGSVLEMGCHDTSKSLSLQTATGYANYAIGEPYGTGHVYSHYWAASEGNSASFSGLGVQLDLPGSSVKFTGSLKGSLQYGVVRLQGVWETFGKAQDAPYSCYWDIDVRDRFLDMPKMEERVGRAIFAALQDVLSKRLANIGLEMPSGITHFTSVLQGLYGADYFGSVGLALRDGPNWVESLDPAIDATPSP